MAEKNIQNVLTVEGKKKLEAELKQLVEVDEPKAHDELNFARSQGDLSENSDYDAAREKCEKIKARIAEIKYTLDHYTVVDTPIDNSVVSVGGGLVKCRRVDNGKEYSFHIVGAQEADPTKNKISNNSPVAQALTGHKVGEICEVNAKISYSMEILSIGD